jgi:hypothetical protein
VVLSYLELQVRTAAMHAAAEGGDAAHSGYKGRLERRQVGSEMLGWKGYGTARGSCSVVQQQAMQHPGGGGLQAMGW